MDTTTQRAQLSAEVDAQRGRIQRMHSETAEAQARIDKLEQELKQVQSEVKDKQAQVRDEVPSLLGHSSAHTPTCSSSLTRPAVTCESSAKRRRDCQQTWTLSELS